MTQARPTPHPTAAPGDLAVNVASFRRHLRAGERVAQHGPRLRRRRRAARRLPRCPGHADRRRRRSSREHVEAFVAYLLDATKPDGSKRWKPATANNRFRGCQRFFNWLVEEGELKTSPMARMKPPRIPEQPPEVLREDDLKKLLATCRQGHDASPAGATTPCSASSSTPASGGPRSRACASRPDDEATNDVDLDQGLLRVLGKGRRERVVGIGRGRSMALDRYVRDRAKHRDAHTPVALAREARPADRLRASSRSSRHAACRPASATTSTRTSSATASRTLGWPTGATSRSSCASPAGARRRCCVGTRPRPRPSGPSPHTSG